MRIVCISDTHGQHGNLTVPPGDLVLHAGDFTKRGTQLEVREFLHWFARLPHRHKVFIGGNHDFFLEKSPALFAEMIPANCHYLNDSGIEIEGIRIWGSPITPFFYDWAFNRHRGAEIRQHWDLISPATDLLITHGPAYGMLDQTFLGAHVGCEELRQTIQTVKPRLHLFGHIHEAYGQHLAGETLFVNASVVNLQYRLCNLPQIVEWDDQPLAPI